MKKKNLSNMVLRYFIGFNDAEERFKMLVDFLGRSGISRVILFSETFTENSAILPEEYYKNHVELLRPYVKKLISAVNFGDDESVKYFQRCVKNKGIIDELEKMGVQEGDTVSIYDFEFDFVY